MNVLALKGEIVKSGYTHAQVAKMLGLSSSTFSRRLKRGSFGLDEADKLISILHISNPEHIFFESKTT